MSETNDKKELAPVEQMVRFEITELDDAALDEVTGGIINNPEPTNGSQCQCTNSSLC